MLPILRNKGVEISPVALDTAVVENLAQRQAGAENHFFFRLALDGAKLLELGEPDDNLRHLLAALHVGIKVRTARHEHGIGSAVCHHLYGLGEGLRLKITKLGESQH